MIAAIVLAASIQSSLQTFTLQADPTQLQVKQGQAVMCVWRGDDWKCNEAFVTKDAPVTIGLANRMGDHLWWVGMTASADLFSTAWTLNRCPTCREGNPLGFNSEARIALKAAGLIATTTTLWKLESGGHSKTAKRARWIAVGINFLLIGNNLYHGIRQK